MVHRVVLIFFATLLGGCIWHPGPVGDIKDLIDKNLSREGWQYVEHYEHMGKLTIAVSVPPSLSDLAFRDDLERKFLIRTASGACPTGLYINMDKSLGRPFNPATAIIGDEFKGVESFVIDIKAQDGALIGSYDCLMP
jgi:hypothetical protein